MQHFRLGRSMKSGRVFRSATPITEDQLRAHAPSVFADSAHESRSERFVPVPTIEVVRGLQREGFDIYETVQGNSRVPGKAEFTKHMIRLRHRNAPARITERLGGAYEVILTNANDGTSAYALASGFFRFVCLNGLIAGKLLETQKVRHSGNAVDDVIEGTYRVLNDQPLVHEEVEAFHGVRLSLDERVAFARAALEVRYPRTEEEETPRPIRHEALLTTRRVEDQDTSLWHTLNVVQENAIVGGQHGRVETRDVRRGFRRTTTRPLESVDGRLSLNRALWTLASEMARIKGAA